RVLPSASRGSCWDRYSFPARRSSDLIGFCFAYAQARLQFRGKRLLHLIALLPIVSPPFAVATAVITLFGRSGLITNQLLGLEYNVYGLSGLTIVLGLRSEEHTSELQSREKLVC